MTKVVNSGHKSSQNDNLEISIEVSNSNFLCLFICMKNSDSDSLLTERVAISDNGQVLVENGMEKFMPEQVIFLSSTAKY